VANKKIKFNITEKQELEILRTALINERQSFIPHWRDLGEYMLPTRPLFTINNSNKGDRRNKKIIDATAGLSIRIAKAGMMSGISNPAKPWFILGLNNPEYESLYAVKYWLSTVTKLMQVIFLKSNLYNALPLMYGDLIVFGTAAMGVENDERDLLRFHSFPIGSYCIAEDEKGQVNVFFREFRMTIRQLILKFANVDAHNEIIWGNFSQTIKNLYDMKSYDTWIEVCHFVIPNEDYSSDDPSTKKFKSIYYERSSYGAGRNQINNINDKTYLRKKGFDYFPVLCPRWSKTGEDVYGTDCPGMMALGDVRELQLLAKRNAQALEKKIIPPMIAPTSLKNQRVSILPGDITWSDEREGQKGIRAAHTVDIRLDELNQYMQEHRYRISRYFFEDLFLAITNLDRKEITAREIDERKEEKLFALGDFLTQLNKDVYDQLIEITFDNMVKNGLIPEPPEEIQGQPIKVEYISIMAQAQKLLGIISIERFARFSQELITQTQQPDLLDKIDTDELIDVYGEMSGIPVGIVRPDDVVEEIRKGRQEAIAERQKMLAQEQQMQGIESGARAAKDLSKADLKGENVLSNIVRQAQGKRQV